MFITSKLLESVPGIQHGFGSRSEEVPTPFQKRWPEEQPEWLQVHGIDMTEITHPGQKCGNVDALFSRTPGTIVAIRTADCVPILMAHRDGKTVVGVHAGWRGTHARILHAVWNQLLKNGEKPNEWVAAIGPSIGPCCYEVNAELARDFATRFGANFVSAKNHLDLPAINEKQLRDIGLEQVELLRACTRCSVGNSNKEGTKTPLFNSYRREGSGTRQYSMIEILN